MPAERVSIGRRRGAVAPFLLALMLTIGTAAGCRNPLRNPLVTATVVNDGPALRLLEFDYPYASFGADALGANGALHHRFPIEGAGALTLHFTDSRGKDHTAQGPQVHKGESGSLTATIDASGAVQWKLNLTGK